MGKRKEKGHK